MPKLHKLDISSWVYLNAMMEVFDNVSVVIDGSDININNHDPEDTQSIVIFHNHFIKLLNTRGPYVLEVEDRNPSNSLRR